jgi:hypothetical protein
MIIYGIKKKKKKETGFVYDERMLYHEAPIPHIENPNRLRDVYTHLYLANLVQQCIFLGRVSY